MAVDIITYFHAASVQMVNIHDNGSVPQTLIRCDARPINSQTFLLHSKVASLWVVVKISAVVEQNTIKKNMNVLFKTRSQTNGSLLQAL